MNLKYLFAKIKYILHQRNDEVISNFFRKQGVLVGKDCHIYSDITTSENYLIEIGDSVTISTDVQFLTHDSSIAKLDSSYTDMFGKIKIGSNVFIGARSIILPGITIGANVIVGAGSVITKSIPKNVIVGGNPAKFIKNIDYDFGFARKHGFNINSLTVEAKQELILSNPSKLVVK